MIEERAVILSLDNLSGIPLATLEIERKNACGLCGQTRGCGNSIWGKLFAHHSTAFKAQNHINAKEGQSVIVGINETALLKSALLLYILPLVTLFLGAILATKINPSDVSAMVGAVVGLMMGLLWVKGHTISNSYFSLQQPVILRLAFQETVINFD
jgi:sigma-E factor negative regulatory protein RseC